MASKLHRTRYLRTHLPIEAALRGAGLELEWSDAMNGYTLDDGRLNVGYVGSVWRAGTAAAAATSIDSVDSFSLSSSLDAVRPVAAVGI